MSRLFEGPLLSAAGFFWAIAAGAAVWWIVLWSRRAAGGYRSSYLAGTEKRLDEMFLDIPAERIFNLSLAGGAGGFVVGFLAAGGIRGGGAIAGGLVLGGILGLLGFFLPRWFLARLQRRRRRAFDRQLVDALMTMGNSLRAGFSIRQAFEMVVREGQNPIAQEFGLLLQQTRMGVPFDEALDALARRVGSEDLDLMVVAIETARQTGGNITEVFDRLASTIRERSRVAGRLRSLTAQGRLQAAVVGMMPLLLGGMLTLVDPALMRNFVHHPIGLAAIGVVIVLETVGFLVIRRIVTIDI